MNFTSIMKIFLVSYFAHKLHSTFVFWGATNSIFKSTHQVLTSGLFVARGSLVVVRWNTLVVEWVSPLVVHNKLFEGEVRKPQAFLMVSAVIGHSRSEVPYSVLWSFRLKKSFGWTFHQLLLSQRYVKILRRYNNRYSRRCYRIWPWKELHQLLRLRIPTQFHSDYWQHIHVGTELHIRNNCTRNHPQ